MAHNTEHSLSWIRVGGVCGLLSIGAYLAAAFAPLPDTLSYAAAFAFGPLLAVGAAGLYHCLALSHRGPVVQVAAIAAIAGSVTVLIMLTTQQAILGMMKRVIAGASDPASADIYRKVADGLDAVHLGIDVAWDVLISIAVILFGIEMMRHPKFGRVMGMLGVVLGGLLLGFNLWYFPVPPATANSIDWGPFVALWMLVTFILLLRAVQWAREQD
ncbi:MAG: hypothetical protein AB7P24_21695 [Nitrospira sp.]|nr:hypothetical protein [Nitrosomonas nitrosa]